MSIDVTVIGDIMLDEYSTGSADRLSPEAPVPIIENPMTSYFLGGAANTAANVVSLGGSSAVIGALGDDSSGNQVRELFSNAGIELRASISDSYRTTTKHRYLAGQHQVLRVDVEDRALSRAMKEEIFFSIESIDSPIVVISDYQKGVIDPETTRLIFARARTIDARVIVDSKSSDFSSFHGSTLLTPNLHEARKASGKNNPRDAAVELAKVTHSDVLVTLGEKGMIFASQDGLLEIPAEASQVSDVTGAGDSVVAAVAQKLAEGSSIIESIRWANSVAAIAVSHVGTFAVPAESVKHG